MISFFFATMVVLTMTANDNIRNPQDIVAIDELAPIYENNTLVGYNYGDSNYSDYEEYSNSIWEDRSGTIYNSMSYYLDLGSYTIGYKFVTDVYNRGTASCVADFKVQVLGESVSTNIYLTNIQVYTIVGGSSNYVSLPDVYFRGQLGYYVDNEDGNYSFDLPSSNFNDIFIKYDIRCYSVLSEQSNWYNNGYNDGYQAGNELGLTDGYNSGYSAGYQAGYEQGFSTDSTVTSIFSGILQVALVPINFFLAIFNFEILGVNLAGFIRALFTIAITIIIIRTIFGGKGASDS